MDRRWSYNLSSTQTFFALQALTTVPIALETTYMTDFDKTLSFISMKYKMDIIKSFQSRSIIDKVKIEAFTKSTRR